MRLRCYLRYMPPYAGSPVHYLRMYGLECLTYLIWSLQAECDGRWLALVDQTWPLTIDPVNIEPFWKVPTIACRLPAATGLGRRRFLHVSSANCLFRSLYFLLALAGPRVTRGFFGGVVDRKTLHSAGVTLNIPFCRPWVSDMSSHCAIKH